ncbi:MAG: AI-2E family transporter [Terriglobales bacterium]
MSAIQPQAAPNPATTPEEEVELLRGSVKAGMVAQFVIAFAAAVGLIYLLKLVLVTVMIAALLAFALDPLVVGLTRLRIPRPAGAAIALLLLLGLSVSLSFFFYNRAIEFAEELPRFSATIRDDLQKLQAQADKLENSTRTILPDHPGKKPIPVQVQEAPGLTKLISAGASQFGDLALAISFVPFLIYFMLTWKNHVHSATLHVFPKESRLVAYRTIGRISAMVRSFIAGNLLVGLLNAIASTAIFGAVHLPYFYFLGPISAFVGLVPYLGVAFALLAPIAAGIGVLTKAQLAVVFIAVIALHILTMNLLYPKLIGRRLSLNPLAVALSLLFWAWIWGAFGLVLAIPLMASTKIICDYIEPLQGLGDWLGN